MTASQNDRIAAESVRGERRPSTVERTWRVSLKELCQALGIPFRGGPLDGLWKIEASGDNEVRITHRSLREGN